MNHTASMKSRRIDHRVYEIKAGDRTFTVDGQNHEFDSREWQLFEEYATGIEWIETYSTKREAVDYIVKVCEQ